MKYNIYEQVEKLLEARSVDYMTSEEISLKNELLKLLVKEKHAAYAKRLKFYDVNIVEIDPRIGGDPEFTAAISMVKPVVFISRGFLVAGAFKQLNVLMRHELAHNLMQHQIRMEKKLGKEVANKLGESNSFHDLLNIIMDFEISNTRYTRADKQLIRNLKLNGKTISGLVTEDHRDAWKTLTLEQMFEQSEQELEVIRQSILKNNKSADTKRQNLEVAYNSIYEYTDVNCPGYIFGVKKDGKSVEDLIKTSKLYTKQLGDSYKKLVDNLLDRCAKVSKSKLTDILIKLANTQFKSALNFGNFQLKSPEQKFVASQVLKYLIGNIAEKPVQDIRRAYHSQRYINAYNKTVDEALNSLSSRELNELLDQLADLGIIPEHTKYGTLSEEQYKQRYPEKFDGGNN